MTAYVYTALTFAPVQGFIEKSRKLRDLYGSSYILSFLAWAVCYQAEHTANCTVQSPALINVTQGLPNQIVVMGDFPKAVAQGAFNRAWKSIVRGCRAWIETRLPHETYIWQRDWGLWENYAWEFFWAQAMADDTTTPVRERLNEVKRSRDWVGINWTGESSTLSGTDAIAWPHLGYNRPDLTSYRDQQESIRGFYQSLSNVIGEAFINPDEELSVPELIKRLITHDDVAAQVIKTFKAVTPVPLGDEDEAQLTAIAAELRPDDFNPNSFKDLNRHKKTEPKYWTGWFLGDGDSAGQYLQRHSSPQELNAFSAQMREWGEAIRNPNNSYLPGQGRMIYAGGDDFMGVLYGRNDQIQPETCVNWLSRFKRDFWEGQTLQPTARQFAYGADRPKPITASVGFVWAAPNVPQRDVLQHCREAEQSAKRQGRDRIAFRILFNGGNCLEWACPWWLLEGDFAEATVPLPFADSENSGLLASYRDRHRVGTSNGEPNWTHLYNDVAQLEARHAFQPHLIAVALGLIEIYFGQPHRAVLATPSNWWNREGPTGDRRFSGILGSAQAYLPDIDVNDATALAQLQQQPEVRQDFNTWVINLAKVGFHLHREVRPTLSQVVQL